MTKEGYQDAATGKIQVAQRQDHVGLTIVSMNAGPCETAFEYTAPHALSLMMVSLTVTGADGVSTKYANLYFTGTSGGRRITYANGISCWQVPQILHLR